MFDKLEAKMEAERIYICIDLKSFYASVECVERGLDPLTAKLVVADPERTEKTICLAVTPAMKSLGVSSRCRVFEIPKDIEYIMAVPRMQLYVEYSAKIYGIYLKYFSKDDIHVYSIDEVFIDATDYFSLYKKSPRQLSQEIMREVLKKTGITATAGIGTNLYLAKVALDILAKHASDKIGYLDEQMYCEKLWNYRPLQDFWRIGRGTAKKLEQIGVLTMGELARSDERVLFKLFGIDAELLIDHAWGRENTRMSDIKKYQPKTNCITSGQVLCEPYSYDKGRLIVKEMADSLSLELVERGVVTDSITLHIGYQSRTERLPAHGTITMPMTTSSTRRIVEYTTRLYDRIVDPCADIRRVNLSFNNVVPEGIVQYDLFSMPEDAEREKNLQMATLEIQHKYGKNAILKGMNLETGAKTIERNEQIGGHKK